MQIPFTPLQGNQVSCQTKLIFCDQSRFASYLLKIDGLLTKCALKNTISCHNFKDKAPNGRLTSFHS